MICAIENVIDFSGCDFDTTFKLVLIPVKHWRVCIHRRQSLYKVFTQSYRYIYIYIYIYKLGSRLINKQPNNLVENIFGSMKNPIAILSIRDRSSETNHSNIHLF